jgi:hypothetical protein
MKTAWKASTSLSDDRTGSGKTFLPQRPALPFSKTLIPRLWKSVIPSSLIFIVLAFAAPGVAVTFDLSNPSGVLGTQQDYSAGLATLTAYGYKLDTGSAIFGPTIGAAENLFGNTGGANGPGLGLANVADHGILGGYLVELDFSNLYSQGFRNFTLTIGGIQSGEEYGIYSFDAPSIPGSHEVLVGHQVGSFIASSDIGSQTLDISTWIDTHQVLGVREFIGTVVLQSVTAAPDGGSTLVLLGLASIGLMAAARRFGKNWPRSSQPCG